MGENLNSKNKNSKRWYKGLLVKHEILEGFKCGNNSWCVVTKDFGELFTYKQELFDRAMNEGYVEIEHEDYLEDV